MGVSELKVEISPEKFADELKDVLNNFTNEVADATKKAARETASLCAAELRKTAPKRTGEYAKGWRSKQDSRSPVGCVVYNNTKPSLTFLLEYGHATVGGAERKGARPHIKAAETKYVQEYIEKVKGILK